MVLDFVKQKPHLDVVDEVVECSCVAFGKDRVNLPFFRQHIPLVDESVDSRGDQDLVNVLQ